MMILSQLINAMADKAIYLIPGLIALLTVLVTGPVFIPWLRKLKFGQEILEIGPNWHKIKSGTPTMGGLMFILGVVIAMAVALLVKFDLRLLMMVLVSVGFGLIGFVDDYVKVVKKRNLGLTARQKTFLQLLVSAGYLATLALAGDVGCALGPGLIGFVAERTDMGLKAGILCAVIFPIAAFILLRIIKNGVKTHDADTTASD